MSDLEPFLQSCLSDGLRIEKLACQGNVFVVEILDADDERHCIEFWRLDDERRAYRKGRILAFAHRTPENASPPYELERRVIAMLVQHEERIAALAESFVELPVPRPIAGRPIFLREGALVQRILRVIAKTGSIEQAVRRVLDEAWSTESHPSEVQLYFETECGQACEFCEEPQLRTKAYRRALNRLVVLQHDAGLDIVSTGVFRAFVDIATDRGWPIRITGHDWTRHPHRDALLRVLENKRGAHIRLQGPSLALHDSSLARRIAALPGLEWVATTLQSSDPDEHDAIVGAKGAHEQLIAALENLQSLGVTVILSLVLTRRAVRSLTKTLDFLKERRWLIELTAFVPDRAVGNVGNRLVPLDELRNAISKSLPSAREIIASLVGVPYCAVPPELRNKVAPVLRTSERAPLQFAPSCQSCAMRNSCSGLVAEYQQTYGSRGVEAITGS